MASKDGVRRVNETGSMGAVGRWGSGWIWLRDEEATGGCPLTVGPSRLAWPFCFAVAALEE
jgi:hypothetical protein